MKAYGERVWSTLVSFRSFLRCSPLFVSDRPKTPLRVFCIMAFDTLHRLRHAKPMPVGKHRVLAALLDFGGCANASFDNKDYPHEEIRRTRQLLSDAGLNSLVEDFQRRLWELETKRPSLLEGECQFYEVSAYREAVLRLVLGTVATTATGANGIDEGIHATHCDDDLKVLFRIAMLCQIVDDALDYPNDMSAGLPSFLTSAKSLPEAIEMTLQSARAYADIRDLPRSDRGFPLRLALRFVSICAKQAIRLCRWRFASRPARRSTDSGRAHD